MKQHENLITSGELHLFACGSVSKRSTLMACIRIGVISTSTLERTAPPFNIASELNDDASSYDELVERYLQGLQRCNDWLIECGAAKCDLAVLPEAFSTLFLPWRFSSTYCALPFHFLLQPQPMLDANQQGYYGWKALMVMLEAARACKMHVVGGMLVDISAPASTTRQFHNAAILVDGEGSIVGYYAKRYPVEQELKQGMLPGHRDGTRFLPPFAKQLLGQYPQNQFGRCVVETALGRIGLSICFDANFDELWEEMRQCDPHIVIWISAYEGGNLIRSRALQLLVPIATAVHPYHARIMNPLGLTMAETSRWSRTVHFDVDLSARVFHTDAQAVHISSIKKEYGTRVNIQAFTEDHVFIVSRCRLTEKTDSNLLEEISDRYGLVSYRSYITRCRSAVQRLVLAE